MLCCYQFTQIFCALNGFTCASPAKSPSSSGSLASSTSGLSESQFEYCGCPIQFVSAALKRVHGENSRVSLTGSREKLAGAFCVLEHLPFWQKHATGFPRASSLSSFLWVFVFWAESGDRSSCDFSLTFWFRVFAAHIAEVQQSCDHDVGDVGVAELEELGDKTPGQRVARTSLFYTLSFAILDEVL